MKFSGFDVTQINLALESGPHSPGLHGLLLTFLHEGGSKKDLEYIVRVIYSNSYS